MKQLDVSVRLRHVADAAEAIQRFVAGKTLDDYRADPLIRSAVERQFEIIGEALRYAIQLQHSVATAVTGARRVIDFRNVLAHDYEAIWADAVWSHIHSHLPLLLSEVRALLLR